MDDGLVTVEQAVAVFDVNAETLRLLAEYGEIKGAVEVRGVHGPEWRLPPAALVALGYGTEGIDPTDTGALVAVVRRLADELDQAQRANARLTRELAKAVADAAALRRNLGTRRRLTDPGPRGNGALDVRDSAAG